MPSGSYQQVYVKCPFYLSDNGKNVIAREGLIPNSTIRSHYRYGSDYRKQIGIFCCGKYENCEIYAALKLKYEEE